jgi:hypothetical protein
VTDTVLANANKKRDLLAAEINSLAQRIDEIKRELAKIDAWIAQWHEFAGVSRSSSQKQKEEFPILKGREAPKITRTTGNPKKEEVAEAAREIIAERGEPISRADLFKALAERGIKIQSESDPEMVLSTMLWRTRNRVVRLKTGGYWLPERPWPPAGYNPENYDPTQVTFLQAFPS